MSGIFDVLNKQELTHIQYRYFELSSSDPKYFPYFKKNLKCYHIHLYVNLNMFPLFPLISQNKMCVCDDFVIPNKPVDDGWRQKHQSQMVYAKCSIISNYRPYRTFIGRPI